MADQATISRTKQVRDVLGPEAFLVKLGRRNLAAGCPLEGGGARLFVLREVKDGSFNGMPVDAAWATKDQDAIEAILPFYKDILQ